MLTIEATINNQLRRSRKQGVRLRNSMDRHLKPFGPWLFGETL